MSDAALTGGKVYLRRLERGDLGRTWEWLHRPDVYERIGVAVPFSPSQQDAWFARLENTSDKLVFAICRVDTRAHVGNASLDMIDPRHRNARLSVFIADAGERGHGLGSDAVRLLCRYAFEFLNLHRVWCKADADDPALVRFYQGVGFREEGLMREHEFKGGRYVDKRLFGRLSTDPVPAEPSA